MNPRYDIILRDATIYDGSGAPSFRGDLAIQGDRIATIEPEITATGKEEIDIHGDALSPGFINMLSWACEALLIDGRSQSDIRQGITLEVMGEGTSYGPLNERMKQSWQSFYWQAGSRYVLAWNTLGEYLDHLAQGGISPNVASFVGTSTLRRYIVGEDDRPPTPTELEQMCVLVRQAMQEGALGLSSALIYPPASYAKTEELIALAKAAAGYGGMYISHIRDEADRVLEALEEFLEILHATGMRGEIYHLKTTLRPNFHLMDEVISRIEAARQSGLTVTADVYPYAASATGLDSLLPGWVHDGGDKAMVSRLQNQDVRHKLRKALTDPGYPGWIDHRPPEEILISGFGNPQLRPLTGKTLAEIAQMRGAEPVDALFDILVEDQGQTGAIFFSMSEDNVCKVIRQPWVSFCSDAQSLSAEGVFLQFNPHPRAYGSFARLLGHYVREEGLISLEEAIRRLTSFPAENLHLEGRGRLLPGYYADLVVFDPVSIQDHADYTKPHQYSTGVQHVFVNGIPVLRDGMHTGALPGRVLRPKQG